MPIESIAKLGHGAVAVLQCTQRDIERSRRAPLASRHAACYFVAALVSAGSASTFPLERRVEHRALPGDSGSVDDVELGRLERRRTLVLHDLDPHAVADRLDSF